MKLFQELILKLMNFGDKFSKIVHELAPINKEFNSKKRNIQKKIDDWHKSK